MADEGAVTGRILGNVVHDVARAGEPDGLAVLVLELGHGIDRFVIVLRPPAPDGVKVFEAEAERIDRRVACHARVVVRQLRDLLAHGQRRIEMTLVECDGHRRRLERHAHDVAREKHAAMNGRRRLAAGQTRQEIRMRDHACALLRIERHRLESIARIALAVKLGEPVVEQQVVRPEQIAVV